MAAQSVEDHANRRSIVAGGWIVRLPPLMAALLMVACSGGAPGERAGQTSEAIYGGTLDSDAKENNAVVALRLGNGTQSFTLCTGALIAPNVVLTARHCVGATLTTTVECDAAGNSLNGDQIGDDSAPSTIHVFTGSQPTLTGVPLANGAAIFHPTTTALCNADIALVVLDRAISGITPLAVRLGRPTPVSDAFRAVGYGANDQSQPIGTRFRRDTVPILAVGPTVSESQTALGSSELEVGVSICNGDSGGPALSETTGAVIAVVSRGGACTDSFGHIYTTLDAFQSVFQEAFAMAGGAVVAEGAPMTTAPAPTPTSGAVDAGAPSNTSATPSPVYDLHQGSGSSCSVNAVPDNAEGAVAFAATTALSLLLVRKRRRRVASERCV